MKKYFYQFFVGMLLFYCCILFYGETKVRADLREADQKREGSAPGRRRERRFLQLEIYENPY